MAFFGLRFGREVTRNTDARLIHGFCFDNFQSNFVTNAKKGAGRDYKDLNWQPAFGADWAALMFGFWIKRSGNHDFRLYFLQFCGSSIHHPLSKSEGAK